MAKNAQADRELEKHSREFLIEILRRMALIREFDTRLRNLSDQNLIRGSSHPCIGQEAVAVGACFALKPSDYITSTHRGHGHAIAKGADVNRMMAELLGRADGCCRGKGGSMHIADFSINMLGANGIVGGGIGLAAGAAFSASVRQSEQIALCFIGEGAVNQGILLECGNMAAVWKLPLVVVCENNQFSMSTRPEEVTSVQSLADRAQGLGIPGTSVDGMDVLATFHCVAAAVNRAREGKGPFFIEAKCYRFEGHFLGDGLKYRSADELGEWHRKDPLRLFKERLISARVLTPEQISQMLAEVEQQINLSVEFAKQSPFPQRETAWDDVYA